MTFNIHFTGFINKCSVANPVWMKCHTLEGVLMEHAVNWNKMFPLTRVVKLPNTAIGSMHTHRPTTVLLAFAGIGSNKMMNPFQNSYLQN